MFSFQIAAALQEEEPSSAESAVLPEGVRIKLQEILSFLNHNIGQLVRDAEPIRAVLKSLEGQLPKPIEEALIPAAFIDSHQVQVLRAQKCLTDCLQQKQIAKQRDDLKGLVNSTCEEIDSLNSAQANLQKTKGELEAKRDHLL
jgi:hypothetical protein